MQSPFVADETGRDASARREAVELERDVGRVAPGRQVAGVLGYWWRIALRHGPIDVALLPVNGAVLRFPHRRPASPFAAALEPEHAAVAAEILGARLAIPIHAEGYELDGVYRPVRDAVERFAVAASERGVPVRALGLGESIVVSAADDRADEVVPG